MGELDDLRQAIAALEAQRPTLGDRIVEAALASLRDRLAALEESGQPAAQQRRLATVLFADVVNSTQLSQDLEPDEVLDVMDGALKRMAAPVRAYGGQVTRFMGDGLMAVFGLSVTHENDARQAVRAGLAIVEAARAYAEELDRTHGLLGFSVRVGIDTGLVVSGGFSEGDDTVMGMTVNLAARMEQAALPGSVLVSRHTYQHVRGAFEVEPVAPIKAKGFAQAIPAYRVRAARPRTFRTVTRGVEGVETRMVGRAEELHHLEAAFARTVAENASYLVTILGEAGVGKSRLLYEFDRWLIQVPTRALAFKARARPQVSDSPYGLVREAFAYRFGILGSDTDTAVRQKLEAGLAEYLGSDAQRQAHLIGALLGFGFSDSPHVAGVASEPARLRQEAEFYLTRFFSAVTQRVPAVILLDDVHWADGPSLDLVVQIVRECPDARLLVVCLGRPTLLEGHPTWGSNQDLPAERSSQIVLGPLSAYESRQLLGAILHRVETPPESLCDQVLAMAEGNPLYLEALIQMMVDDGVFRRGPGRSSWKVDSDRLERVHVPSTLTAVLQARLDGLPRREKSLLQRASVVGRVFWSAAVEALGSEARTLAADLEAVVGRGLAEHSEPSTFAHTSEYRFKHALMRDTAYDTILKRDRVLYHGQAAAWLEQVTQASGRSDEHAAVVAEHYEQAGNADAASDWYLRAGTRAGAQGAPVEACRFFDRALYLLPDQDRDRRWRALLGRDLALGTLGKSESRQSDDLALVALALEIGDDIRVAEAYYRRAYYLGVTGQYAEEIDACNKALDAAARGGSLNLQALVLSLKVLCHWRMGDLQAAQQAADRALTCLKDISDEEIQVRTLTNVAGLYTESGDLARAAQLLKRQVEINNRRGSREGEAVGLSNLGYTYILLGLYPMAVGALERARELATSIGHRIFTTYSGLNLGLAYMRLNDLSRAEEILRQSSAALEAMSDRFGRASSLTYLAMVREQAGDVEGALARFVTARETLVQIGATGYATDALAGMTRSLVAGGQVDRADEPARAVWNCLTQQSASVLEFPALAYETCAAAFSARGDRAAAQEAIEAGRRYLLAEADRISIPEWRRSFLEDVPEHRRILDQWTAMNKQEE